MERKYPASIFIFGTIMNFFLRYFYLAIPGVILCIVGVYITICLYIGLAVLGLDLVLSLYDQIQIRKAALSESDNPEFNNWMDAMYGSNPHNSIMEIIENTMQSDDCADPEQRQQALEQLVVYRTLRETIHDGMTLEEMVDAFAQMCSISVGEPDDLLFEVGTFGFDGETQFQFSLARQFEFLNEAEYVQLHLDVFYTPDRKTKSLHDIKWSATQDGDFFNMVKSSRAFRVVKDMPITKVDVYIGDT